MNECARVVSFIYYILFYAFGDMVHTVFDMLRFLTIWDLGVNVHIDFCNNRSRKNAFNDAIEQCDPNDQWQHSCDPNDHGESVADTRRSIDDGVGDGTGSGEVADGVGDGAGVVGRTCTGSG